MKCAWVVALAACGSGGASHPGALHDGAVVIDRFGKAAAHLLVRDAKHPLPGPGAPIDFDRPPLITAGLGPDGKPVRYYNFDVQPDVPATLYRVVRAGTHELVGEVVDVVPGDPGYSDFWRTRVVEVPASVAAGALTRADQLRGYPHTDGDEVIDCPIVPVGSKARKAEPRTLWYRGHQVTCLRFGAPLALAGGKVPTSPIYVTFGSEGFQTEGGTPQTHNVVFSVPGDLDYSPLWDVHIYEPSFFSKVHDAQSAEQAPLAKHGPLVNCPIVDVE